MKLKLKQPSFHEIVKGLANADGFTVLFQEYLEIYGIS